MRTHTHTHTVLVSLLFGSKKTELNKKLITLSYFSMHDMIMYVKMNEILEVGNMLLQTGTNG